MDIEDIRRIEFKPGDKLVLRVDRPMSCDAMGRIAKVFEEFAPGVPVLILEPGMSFEVLSEAA